ncbi:squalene synthase HpnC [Amycolatopsis saalfeldensis]|uniref:Squalene synthase HpnC n=1 Tax=Amycolatopsis saalfeldensis TaxID=394193 RepID=A0A1H8ULW3_9PSEU|nr:squalene synthase HpnC [Amycolatopsis saalfeldensis]SEP04210.1 squalene synthase HpnC [Amycolatopsis saalfeldensis]
MSPTSPGRHLPAAAGLREKRQAENFPVALRVLPRELRADLTAVYAVARTIDDLGDEAEGDRVAQLKAFGEELAGAWDGREPTHPVIRGLLPAIHGGRADAAPFGRLVEANLQDQHVTRYPAYEDLLAYCRLSADPVGRIVLRLFDVRDERAAQLSDRVCTGLQLVEHWQDVAEDFANGRVYLPQEDLAAFGVAETELGAARGSREFRELMRFEIDRAAALLGSGAPLVGQLHGWARLAVGGFVAGGLAAVDALRETGGDVLGRPARPSKAGVLGWLVWLGFGRSQGGSQGEPKAGRRSG